jgi:cation transport protein ChaC
MLPDVANLDLFSAEELAERRLQLPVGEDFWVFGYGSLIWHPGFPHLEVRPARVSGYHRRFCGEEVLDYLYEREMITGAYFPRWVKVATAQGPLRAMTFVVDTSHEQYTGRLGLEAITDLVVQGCGDRGTCLEYLEKTVHHLEALGLGDATLKRLLKLARARLKS